MWVGCSQPPVASLEKRSLCADHFLDVASRRLDALESWLNNPSGSREVSSEVQATLAEVLSQVPTVVTGTRTLSTKAREEFVSLSERASKLYRQARRPPRFDRNVSCQIRVSVLSSESPQKCSTVNVSQRGASVETTAEFQLQQVITLQKEDTGKRAKAKVVWVKKKAAKRFLVGIEIMDQDDFWGLQQAAPSAAPPLPRMSSEPKTVKQSK